MVWLEAKGGLEGVAQGVGDGDSRDLCETLGKEVILSDPTREEEGRRRRRGPTDEFVGPRPRPHVAAASPISARLLCPRSQRRAYPLHRRPPPPTPPLRVGRKAGLVRPAVRAAVRGLALGRLSLPPTHCRGRQGPVDLAEGGSGQGRVVPDRLGGRWRRPGPMASHGRARCSSLCFVPAPSTSIFLLSLFRSTDTPMNRSATCCCWRPSARTS